MSDKEKNVKKDVQIHPREGIQEVLIRETDQAPEIRQPVKLRISGNIEAPAEFYKVRLEQNLVNFKKCHVEVDRWDGVIRFYQDQSDCEAAIVTGRLETNPDIDKLEINSGRQFEKESLVETLKLNRHLFDDVEKNMKLVSDLKQLTMRVEQRLEKKDDHRGSRSEVLEQTADSDLDKEFFLNIPVFRGQDPIRFQVELNFNVRDQRISFWLSSPDLAEIIGSHKDSIISDALAPFKEGDVVIIEK